MARHVVTLFVLKGLIPSKEPADAQQLLLVIFFFLLLFYTLYHVLRHTPRMAAKAWSAEISAVAGSIAMSAVLIALLARFHARPVFEWYGVTLNTIVSTISVTMKALLLFAIAECIGQWKWILLHRSRRKLLDFERIDQASRGPLGCASLSWRKDTPRVLLLNLLWRLESINDNIIKVVLATGVGNDHHDGCDRPLLSAASPTGAHGQIRSER